MRLPPPLRRVVLAAGLLLAAAGPASAATTTVSFSANAYAVVGDAEANFIYGHDYVSNTAWVEFEESGGGTVVAGAGCVQNSATVLCPIYNAATTLTADLGAGNDNFKWVGNPTATIDAGAGSDKIETSVGDAVVRVRDGEQDSVFCGQGSEVVTADAIDVVDPLCTTVDLPAADPGTGGSPENGPAGTPVPTPTPPAFSTITLKGKKGAFKLSLIAAVPTSITVTVTRKGAKKPLGKTTFKATKAEVPVSRTFRKIGGKSLKAGTYKVKLEAGQTKRTLSVKVK